jgi:hypothetical protein
MVDNAVDYCEKYANASALIVVPTALDVKVVVDDLNSRMLDVAWTRGWLNFGNGSVLLVCNSLGVDPHLSGAEFQFIGILGADRIEDLREVRKYLWTRWRRVLGKNLPLMFIER